MVIDTSAIVAILSDEPERPAFNEQIITATRRLLSAASYTEAGIVLTSKHGRVGGHYLSLFVARAEIDVCPIDRDQAEIAIEAYERFGKGRHLAGLNYGDCFAYALSRATNEPLLFKGQDFIHTDVARM